MSTRKVISAYRLTLTQGQLEIPCHVIYFVVDPIETSRSIKTTHYGVIINAVGKFRGAVAARMYKKPVTLSKSKLNSYFEDIRDEAEGRAFAFGIDGMEFDAVVTSWNPVEGRGWVKIAQWDQVMPIYACNIEGKRSWWPEHACVSYERGQHVRVQFKEPHFVIGLTPGTFNAEQFASQDRSRMTFNVNEAGQVTSGLFGGTK